MHEDLVKEQRVSPHAVHEVIFVIKQLNVDVLASILDDISDPTSPNYGKHMTASEIADISGNPDARDAVVSYLNGAGATVTQESLFGEYITAQATVGVWEAMFNTEFFSFAVEPARHGGVTRPATATVERYIRTESYSVPIALDSHVESVMNTVQMPTMTSNKVAPKRAPTKETALDFEVQATAYVTPASLITSYNIDVTVKHPLATQAFFQTGSDYYSQGDLKTHQTYYGLPLNPVNQSILNHNATVAFCTANVGNCAEGNLDVQYMMAVSRSPTISYYSSLGLTSSWLALVASTANPPKVISISYGMDEAYCATSELNAFSVQAMKLGLMGTTIVVAAGDDGAPGWYARTDLTQCRYAVMFPASCPYITSIGATMVSAQSDSLEITLLCILHIHHSHLFSSSLTYSVGYWILRGCLSVQPWKCDH
jgi:tripeptidyl-peptidase-1